MDELPDARSLGVRRGARIHVAFHEGQVDELLGQIVLPEDRAHHARVAPRPPEGLGDVVRSVRLEMLERGFDPAVEYDRKVRHSAADRG